MNAAEQDRSPSPWHDGELTIQRRVGVAERMADVGRRVIRDHLIAQHREFYPLLPYVVLGTVDPAGDAWATVRGGREGFLQAVTPHRLSMQIPRDPGDPADAGMEDGDGIGLLGIDLITRRRNRLNGMVRRGGGHGLELAVEWSYGNCPQYIQRREFAFTRDPAEPSPDPVVAREALDEHARALIGRADTFFVASYIQRDGGRRLVDVSHRGGKPGFVRLDADGGLTIPDFAGNLFFNTLGNFLVNPKAGLVFPDFKTGDLLQLTGDAEVILESPEIAAFQGAERIWRFRPRRILFRPGALPLRWTIDPNGASPNALMTGNWVEAERRQKAAALAKEWRAFRVAKIADESALIKSFHLEPMDGGALIPHAAGQFLPIRLAMADVGSVPALRTYTLSVAPSDGIYRVSVKREGVVSSYLHDRVREGDVVEARGPDGGFTLDALEPRPAVLLAGGIGVTPLLAMLRHIVYEGLRKRRIRPTWFFYSARSKADRAFDGELAGLVLASQGEVRLVRVLSSGDGAIEGQDYEALGRIDKALLTQTLPFDDYDFYLCGPPTFSQSIYDTLRRLRVRNDRLHAEAFGPGALIRTPDQGANLEALPAAATTAVRIAFTTSAKEARWTPEAGSLLDLAEARGLAPAFSCREGNCGTCRTRILKGAVTYAKAPTFKTADGEALICRAVPAAAAPGEDDSVHLEL